MTVTNEIEYLDLEATELRSPTFLSRISKIFIDTVKSNWKVVLFLIIGNLAIFYIYKKFKNKINS